MGLRERLSKYDRKARESDLTDDSEMPLQWIAETIQQQRSKREAQRAKPETRREACIRDYFQHQITRCEVRAKLSLDRCPATTSFHQLIKDQLKIIMQNLEDFESTNASYKRDNKRADREYNYIELSEIALVKVLINTLRNDIARIERRNAQSRQESKLYEQNMKRLKSMDATIASSLARLNGRRTDSTGGITHSVGGITYRTTGRNPSMDATIARSIARLNDRRTDSTGGRTQRINSSKETSSTGTCGACNGTGRVAGMGDCPFCKQAL